MQNSNIQIKIQNLFTFSKKKYANILRLSTETLKAGGSIVFPTDTAYGLGVDATNLKAVKLLYKIKGRKFNKPVHIIVPGFKMAKKYSKFNHPADKLFRKFLPGPLTLVLKLKSKQKALKLLTAKTGKIGIRMPKNKIALDIVKKFDRPITATSANISGLTTPYTIETVIRQFKKRKLKPDFIINAGRLKKVKPSTLVDVSDNKIKILRKGPIKKQDILDSMRGFLEK